MGGINQTFTFFGINKCNQAQQFINHCHHQFGTDIRNNSWSNIWGSFGIKINFPNSTFCAQNFLQRMSTICTNQRPLCTENGKVLYEPCPFCTKHANFVHITSSLYNEQTRLFDLYFFRQIFTSLTFKTYMSISI